MRMAMPRRFAFLDDGSGAIPAVYPGAEARKRLHSDTAESPDYMRDSEPRLDADQNRAVSRSSRQGDFEHGQCPTGTPQRAVEGSGGEALRPDRQGHQEVRRVRRGGRRLAQHLPRRDLLPARRLGLRQDDAAADDGRIRDADRRLDLDRRRRRDRDAALRAAGQHDVPVLCALSAHVGAQERRVRPAPGPACRSRRSTIASPRS